MDLPGLDDWITRLPDEQPCTCGSDYCDECQRQAELEAAYERAIDQKIDEEKERRWDR